MGKHRLESGIALYKEKYPDNQDTFDIEWFPWYLDPDAPRGVSVDRAAKSIAKNGEERQKEIWERLSKAGRENGVNFKFSGPTGNTLDSHRVIALAKSKGRATQDAVVEEIFKSYFEEEGDITCHDMLRAAGERGGLDGDEVARMLASDEYIDEIEGEVARFRRRRPGLKVPSVSINELFDIAGTPDPPEVMLMFELLKEGLDLPWPQAVKRVPTC